MIPLIILGGMGLVGVGKSLIAVAEQSEATDINSSARNLIQCAKNKVESQRKATEAVLEDYGMRKLRAFNGAIANFIDSFGQLKNVELIDSPELDKLQLGDFSAKSLEGLKNDYQLLMDSGLGLGAGLGSGAALAFGAYNGTMLLATASTGTAISTLSGVAATNATLAWLGGGTLAAGGGGMAMGTMVLGGIVAGPALLIFGHIVGSKAETALANAQANKEVAQTHSQDAEKTTKVLVAIQNVTELANDTFSKITTHLRRSVRELDEVIKTHGVDFSGFSPESRATVFKSVKFAQLIKTMTDTPILDENGALVLSTKKRVQDINLVLDQNEINQS